MQTNQKPYGSDLGRLVDDYSTGFVIMATDDGYAARRRGPGGAPIGPEVRDAALDALAARMDELGNRLNTAVTRKACVPAPRLAYLPLSKRLTKQKVSNP
jgi:hypothetical protein